MSYWKSETPKVVETKKNVLKFYEKAGKLQVCSPNWEDGLGTIRQGKTVTIDLESLFESEEAQELFLHILK